MCCLFKSKQATIVLVRSVANTATDRTTRMQERCRRWRAGQRVACITGHYFRRLLLMPLASISAWLWWSQHDVEQDAMILEQLGRDVNVDRVSHGASRRILRILWHNSVYANRHRIRRRMLLSHWDRVLREMRWLWQWRWRRTWRE